MTFTDGYRVERVYFERLKSLITILKSLKDGVQDETVRTLIENAIDSDGAILLLYRNIGEAWAELADQVQKTRKMLQDLDEKTEKYHDELNERIDEVNNYLMALIRALEARMDAVEADLAQMGRLFTYDLNRVNDEYTLTESGQPVTWAGTVEKVQHVRPHFVTVRGSLDGEVTYLMPREYDTAQASGIFEWYTVGFVGNEIHEVTVTLLPDDSVNVAIHTTDFAAILQRITNLETRMTAAETDIDNLETRMTTAEGDIDTLEQTAENHNDRITDLEECCDDMTENVIPGLQTAIAGKQDALTPGNGIDVTNNEISVDTDVIQEKLTAGTGITIDPNTNEISAVGGDTFPLYAPSKNKVIIPALTYLNYTLSEEEETYLFKYEVNNGTANFDLSNIDSVCDFVNFIITQVGSRAALASSDNTNDCTFFRSDDILVTFSFKKSGYPALQYQKQISLSNTAIKMGNYFENYGKGFSFLFPIKKLIENGYTFSSISVDRSLRAYVKIGTISSTIKSSFKDNLNRLAIQMVGYSL